MALFGRFTPQPQPYKSYPASNCNPYTRDPHPTCTDSPASRPFVMCKMSYRDFFLDVNISHERSFVVNSKREYSVLVGKSEGSAEARTIEFMGSGLKMKAVERRQHREFKLESITSRDSQRNVTVIRPLGKLNVESLEVLDQPFPTSACKIGRPTTSFLIRYIGGFR